MFGDYLRINCWSQNSAGKRAVKIPYFRRATIPRKYPETPIFLDDGGRQKGSLRGGRRGSHHP
jgi:hypothetical protein